MVRLYALDDEMNGEGEHEETNRIVLLSYLLAAQPFVFKAQVRPNRGLDFREQNVREDNERRRVHGFLPQYFCPARIVEGVTRVDGDADERRVAAELDEIVFGVVDDDVDALLDAASHFERRQVCLGLRFGRRNERLGDGAPHDDANCDRPDIRHTFIKIDKVGGGNQVTDVGEKIFSCELLHHLGKKLPSREVRVDSRDHALSQNPSLLRIGPLVRRLS